MTKTPEEMAEEWASGRWYADHDPTVSGESKVGFLAGYKAAKQEYETKIQELEIQLENWQHTAIHGDEGL